MLLLAALLRLKSRPATFSFQVKAGDRGCQGQILLAEALYVGDSSDVLQMAIQLLI